MKVRFLIGGALLAAFIGLLLLDGVLGRPYCFALLTLAAILLSLVEFTGLTRSAGGRPRVPLAPLAFYAALLVLLKIPGLVPRDALPAAGPELWCLVVLTFHLIARSVVAGRTRSATASVGVALFGFTWIAIGLSFYLDILGAYGTGQVISVILVAKAMDMGGLFVGKMMGRRKLCPAVSPHKTVEGAIGGGLSSILVAGLSSIWLTTAPQGFRFVLFGLVLCLVSLLGDLTGSLLKRDAGVKDSATWIPGFGGVIDLMDSLTFAAPAAFFLLGLL